MGQSQSAKRLTFGSSGEFGPVASFLLDRESAGEMELTDRQTKKFQEFQSAQDYYKQKRE